ncbi:MAG TPA: sigma-70 family RNA polymerase sigma factor [Gammaproteobacteria bacterium]|nr:sigma-70 family RNA polymerase sigma factor [Gammaproteobacteria bacterium]
MEIESDMSARLPWPASAAEPDWDAVYAAQLPRVYNYFRYRFGNDVLAEDLTSRTFEKAWRARHRYRSDLAGFATWLLRIARNVGIDHLRAHREHALLDEEAEPAGEGTPEDERSRESDLERLAALVARLPVREQELVALKYGAEATNRAIARVTGLSESNVGTILHRVVQSLRREW